MNRRGFFGAMLAPVGAIVAAKLLPTGYTPKVKAKPKVLPEGGVWAGDIWAEERAKYQHDLTMWLRDEVDEAAFKMMTGKLDG